MIFYELHDGIFSKTQPYKLHYAVAGTSVKSNWHDSVELLFFKKNKGRVFLNTQKYDTAPKDIIFVNSNTVHMINGFDALTEYYCLIVSLDFLSENKLYFENTIFPSVIQDGFVHDIFEKIIDEHSRRDSLSAACITAYIIEIFAFLSRKYYSENSLSSRKNESKTVMVRKALRYIRANYTKKISASDVAKSVNFSKDYLGHSFKEITGNTMVYYINLLRCLHAQELLLHGTANVTAAAFECGFDNIPYFTRTYKKLLGSLPSADEKKARK